MRFGTLAASVMAELVVFNAAQMGAEMISPLNRHNIFQKIGLAFLCLSILSTSDTFKAAIVGRSRRCRRTKQASGGRSRRSVPPAWGWKLAGRCRYSRVARADRNDPVVAVSVVVVVTFS